MSTIAGKIMRRVRGHGRGNWVCSAHDFLDLGSRAAVNQALSRLARSGDLRRVGRGFYDLPRWSTFLNRLVPADIDEAVAALARRYGIRIMQNGIVWANLLGVTTAVPARLSYLTDGATRNVEIGNWTIELKHARPAVMSWIDRPGGPVALALLWLGPYASKDPKVIPTLRRVLPDYVKKDFVRNSANLPGWAVPFARSLMDADSTVAP